MTDPRIKPAQSRLLHDFRFVTRDAGLQVMLNRDGAVVTVMEKAFIGHAVNPQWLNAFRGSEKDAVAFCKAAYVENAETLTPPKSNKS